MNTQDENVHALDMSDALNDTPGGVYGIDPSIQHIQRDQIEIMHRVKFKNNVFCCDLCDVTFTRKYLYVLENGVEKSSLCSELLLFRRVSQLLLPRVNLIRSSC
jgi:hypothetical protein